jgi:hypothetical protein
MAESAELLIDEEIPEQPIRQWVLSFPFQLRFLFASRNGLQRELFAPWLRPHGNALADRTPTTCCIGSSRPSSRFR